MAPILKKHDGELSTLKGVTISRRAHAEQGAVVHDLVTGVVGGGYEMHQKLRTAERG